MTAVEERFCSPRRLEGGGWRCRHWQSQQGEWFCGRCAQPLPSLHIRLDPPAGRIPVSADGTAGGIALLCDGREATAEADLSDFLLEVEFGGTEPRKREVELLDLAIAGRLPLDFGPEESDDPLDLIVRLRHHKRPGPPLPITQGHYNYPHPAIVLEDLGVAVIAPGRPLRFALSMRPPLAELRSARLEIADVSQPVMGTPTMRENALTLDFALDDKLVARLVDAHLMPAATLDLAFKGLADPIKLPVRLAQPPALEITAASNVRSLIGRPARIGVQMRNKGGASASITAASWELQDPTRTVVARGEVTGLIGREVDAHALLNEELRPSFVDDAGQPIAAGRYRLAFSIAFHPAAQESAVETQAAGVNLDIQIKPEEEYGGLVCIDFGTTDTAAAILPPGRNYFQNRVSGQTPVPVELGLIAPFDAQAASYFLPTRVAIGLDERGEHVVLFGEEAVRGVNSLHHGELLDRLKWRLDEQMAGTGGNAVVSIEDVVAGYLDHVRRLIEEHPAVAARVSKVIATRPARFGLMRERALIAAFARAGMEVNLDRFGSGSRPMVSESWPPILMLVPFDEGVGQPSGRLLASLRQAFTDAVFVPQVEVAQLVAAPQFVCIFDIGGGSMDVSLLRISSQDGVRIDVSDEWTWTDDGFAGEGFRDVIVRELRTMAGNAGDPNDDDPVPELETIRRVARDVQFYPLTPFTATFGTFIDLFTRIAEFSIEDRRRLSVMLDQGKPLLPTEETAPEEVKQLLAYLKEEFELWASPPYFNGSLALPLNVGATLPLTGAVLYDLLTRVAIRIALELLPRIDAIFDRLRPRLTNGGQTYQTHFLMTGRGSGFSPVEVMLRWCAEKPSADLTLDPEKVLYFRALGDSAKGITSWGALGLYASRRAAKVFNFKGLGSGGYALWASHLVTGQVLGKALCSRLDYIGPDRWGVPFLCMPDSFETALLTIREDVSVDQVADILIHLSDFDFDLEDVRRSCPNGGLMIDLNAGTVHVEAEFPYQGVNP